MASDLRTTLPNPGGITAFRKLSVLCEARSVAMVPHFTAPIATAAVVHALFDVPGPVMNEVYRPELPAYLKEAYVSRGGRMYRSERPGLGVVADESRSWEVAMVDQRVRPSSTGARASSGRTARTSISDGPRPATGWGCSRSAAGSDGRSGWNR